MKKSQYLHELFLEELEDMLSCEHQILEALPHLIKLVSSKELKEALSSHLKETEQEVVRLKKIFSLTGFPVKEKMCEGVKGILKEVDRMVKNKMKSPCLDAVIISGAQKIEHYEMASYGTLRNFATHLGLDKEVIKFLQESLEEEGAADKKLTQIAQGTSYSEEAVGF